MQTEIKSVKVPYGQSQRAMLARKTKALEIATEHRLKDQVLQLSLELDLIDASFQAELYREIQTVDANIYSILVDSSESRAISASVPSITLNAEPYDFGLTHAQLLASVSARGEAQREHIIHDLSFRLKQACFAPNIDPKVIDVLLFQLTRKLQALHSDSFAVRKRQTFESQMLKLDHIKRDQTARTETLFNIRSGKTWPPIDVIDEKAVVKMILHVPEFSKDDVFVDVDETGMIVNLQGTLKPTPPSGRYIQQEIERGTFNRKIVLDSKVDSESVQAEFREGVLNLVFQKLQRDQSEK